MSALHMASARLSKLRILCLSDLLGGDLSKNIIIFIRHRMTAKKKRKSTHMHALIQTTTLSYIQELV